jgi:hypothetical protein
VAVVAVVAVAAVVAVVGLLAGGGLLAADGLTSAVLKKPLGSRVPSTDRHRHRAPRHRIKNKKNR